MASSFALVIDPHDEYLGYCKDSSIIDFKAEFITMAPIDLAAAMDPHPKTDLPEALNPPFSQRTFNPVHRQPSLNPTP